MLRGLLAWLKSLFGPRRQREKSKAEPGKGFNFNPFRSFRRDRLPSDPPGRIRFQYRRLLQRAGKAGFPRQASQTPGEFAGYLSPKIEDPELSPSLETLTTLYEEARFSRHVLEEDAANQAQEAAAKLSAYLRNKARPARNKGLTGK